MTATVNPHLETGRLRAAISEALAGMPTPKPDAPTALIYARMSIDSKGQELGLTRQVAGEDGALKLCAARGWRVTEDHIFTDNDLSASTGIYRRDYANLMAAVERGEAAIIVTYQLSRLWRNRRERAEGMEILKAHRVRVVTVKGPEVDLSTAYGRAMAGLLGEFDTMESEVKGERLRSSILQKAHSGQQSSGGNRPYGYAPTYEVISKPGEKIKRQITGKVKLHSEESEIVKECTERVLAGESLISVARDLNSRGVTTSTGGPWRTVTLRRILCGARISGRREYVPNGTYTGTRPLVGEIVWTPPEDKNDLPDWAWPAIITIEESDRLRALLTRPERRTTTGGARKALLSGILICSRCERPMVRRKHGPKPRYVCDGNPGRGCGKMFITCDRTDDHIREAVITALNEPEFADRLRHRDAPSNDLHVRIRAAEDELEALAADHGAGEISRTEWRAARTPLTARLEGLRRQLSQTTQTSALDGFIGPLEVMQQRWETSNTSQRRAVVVGAVEQITVSPATLRHRFDPSRLELVWRRGERQESNPHG